MIVLVATGGTIAQAPSEGALHLSASSLLADLGTSEGVGETESFDLLTLPSTHMRPLDMVRIAAEVQRLATRDDVDGIVITHGTATLEETAFLVDLIYSGEKSVVFTGAIRTPRTVGYDGGRNILDAIRVARSGQGAGLGVLVVLNGEIHTARDVIKFDASSINAFASPGFGPIGHVGRTGVEVSRRVPRYPVLLHVPEHAVLPRVEIITTYAGLPGDVVEAIVALEPDGLVVEAMGGGGVPPEIVPALGRAIASGTIVVMTSRCISGRVYQPAPTDDRIEGYGAHLTELGLHLTSLPAIKARLKLMLLLSNRIVPELWM